MKHPETSSIWWRSLVVLGIVVLGLGAAQTLATARRGPSSIPDEVGGVTTTIAVDPTRVSDFLTSVFGTLQASPSPRTPPAEFFQTATPDLRPTPTLNFSGLLHRWTDAGVILFGPPDDFANCYRLDQTGAPWVVNMWLQVDDPENPYRTVYAGAVGEGKPPQQGAVLVSETNPCEWTEYQTSFADGPMEIIAARGHQLALESANSGRRTFFDLDSRVFLAAFSTPTPGPTPTPGQQPPSDLGAYVIIARESAVIGPQAFLGGSAAVLPLSPSTNGVLDLKAGVQLDAYSILAAPDVRLGPSVSVLGDVFYNKIKTNPGTTVLGSLITPLILNLQLPTYPVFTISSNSPKLTVAPGDVENADPGDYDAVLVRPNGRLILTGGTYEMRSLRVESGGSVSCAEAAAICEIRVKESVRFGADSSLGSLNAMVGARSVVVFISARAPDGFMAESSSEVSANVYAPEGRVVLGPNGVFVGSFIARQVEVKAGSSLFADSAFGVGQ